MSTTNGPYLGKDAQNDDDTGIPSIAIETTLTASPRTVDIGGGVMANVEVLNGEIPGPTFRLTVNDTVVVRLVNTLPYPLGIHWHGVELENYSDGTEVTQDGAVPKFGAPPPPPAPAGGTFLYKFKAPRAGLFWYHPHHGNSINRVFRGVYGMIIVTDPAEGPLVGGVLPADTMQMVLSDITVCKGVGSMDPTYLATYVDPATIPLVDDRPEWLMPPPAGQMGLAPVALCETGPTKDDGSAGAAYGAGDVPSLMGQGPPAGIPLVEGQTVLTNGVNVGGRKGTPAKPTALDAPAVTRDIQSGQGLRLQIANCAHLRYFRLRLTRDDVGHVGEQVNLVRVGGEGGLLDKAILEGGNLGTITTGFDPGEILLAPGGRADVVAAIPAGLPVGSVLTLWTRDYTRAGTAPVGAHAGGWAQLPTVPVAHFKVKPGAVGPYTINAGDPLRAAAMMPPVEALGAAVAPILLDPVMIGKTGSGNTDIQFRTGGSPSIDGLIPLPMMFMMSTPYTDAPHISTSRFAESGKLLELTITNTSTAHHPFHLHGFSFQPIKSLPRVPPPPFQGAPPAGGVDPWPYSEFRDTMDLFPDHTLTIRVRLDDRPLADGVIPGGALGRWLFHCHIFFHHMHGMISEVVVTNPAGKEKPNVNVGGSWVFANIGAMAQRHGTFYSREGLNMTLTASKGSVVPNMPSPGGTWNWSYTPVMGDPPFEYVYITAKDTNNLQDQCVFRLQSGGMDAGSDNGDPHILTVDGTKYDFQAAGEFTLLRDTEGMELQARQTPAVTPPPIPDGYTGLTECVSLNTAFAARVGSHRISYQTLRESRLQFFLDGKPAQIPQGGMDLDAHRVTTFAAAGETGIRIDYAHGPVVKVTPHYWTSYGIWYLQIDVSNTSADGAGIMARIPKGSWLPALPSGATVGPMPASHYERYVTLYKTFADAWRVTDQSSLFLYTPTKSTASFTDRDWPPQKPPCINVKPGFPRPVNPVAKNIPIARAKKICSAVTIKDLNENCVFDVVTTGDEDFAKAYLIQQDLRLRSTVVQIVGNKPASRYGEPLVVTATVLPQTRGKEAPAGTIVFVVDGASRPSIKLAKEGRAHLTLRDLKPGDHKIRADHSGGGEGGYYPSSSPNLLHTVMGARPAGANTPMTGGMREAKKEKAKTPARKAKSGKSRK